MLIPRDYQLACIKAHYDYFAARVGNPIFCVPTGGGKSLIIAEFVKNVIEQWPSQRILILTHVKELIEQNYTEFLNQWGILAPVGIYSAGLRRRDTDCSVIFAGIQSVWPRLATEDAESEEEDQDASAAKRSKKPVDDTADALGLFDLVLIDEAHLVPKTSMGRYRAYLAWLSDRNPAMKIIGYTATPYRMEGGLLHKGEGSLFTDLAYNVSLKKLIDDGHLAPLIAKKPKHTIDTTGVGTSAGDYKPGELEAAAIGEGNVRPAVEEMVQLAREHGRKHWLVFACGHEHARQIVEWVRAFAPELRTELIFGTTPPAERAQLVADAKAGLINCFVNVGVLTTGFNWPRCDLIGFMRPTQSTSLYTQILGRGMRTFPGKENCLVLDYGENVITHGPINDINVTDGWVPEKNDGTPKAKACPECLLEVSLTIMECPACGYVWPPVTPRNPKHAATASDAQPVDFSPKRIPKTSLRVHRVDYYRHQKLGGGSPDSLRVQYTCGMSTINEWVCFEHPGFAGRKARDWWISLAGMPVPDTVTEAIARSSELPWPTRIVVQKDGKYDRIVERSFEEAEEVPF